MLRIDLISVQPEMFRGFLEESIVARAVKKGACAIQIHDLKQWGIGRWKKTDDKPYGGGPGMLMRCEPWYAAIESVTRTSIVVEGGRGKLNGADGVRIVLTTPAGKPFTQRDAEALAALANPCASDLPSPRILFLCGHYEGFDARVEALATDRFSVGDFVMTGGELAAAAMTDAIVRLLPGVLGGGPEATSSESFGRAGLLEPPQYTHPQEFRGMKVPEVLLSGDHRQIESWRACEARKRTAEWRPDLLEAENEI